jgi:epoxyqueuosine reductase
MSQPFSRAEVLDAARRLGFSGAGVVPAQPSPYLDAYFAWVKAGYHAGLYYMDRPDRNARRRDLGEVLAGARSVVSVALDYGALAPEAWLHDPRRGRIAAYAWGMDYHVVLRDRLKRLVADLKRMRHKAMVYVDFGALLERSHGENAGLGFVGKNTLLIHPRRGSTFFLGEIVTTAEFDSYDAPLAPAPSCGRCTRCLAACPTDAFPRPFVLDSNRCISYHTIENAGWTPRRLRARFGNWVFGCDVCQDVCPWNRFAPVSDDAAFPSPPEHRAAPPLRDLLSLTEAGYRARYDGGVVLQIGRERWVRNACIAAGNSGDVGLVGALEGLMMHPAPLIRGHAAWAVWRLAGWGRGHDQLLRRERDDGVLAELAALREGWDDALG